MAWTLEITKNARVGLEKAGTVEARRILRFLYERVRMLPNPRELGKALSGDTFAGLWRYRVGAYRVLCEIQDEKITILVVHVGHRREVYK